MRKLISKIDKIGWGKAALWTAGAVAHVGWAAHDIYTRGGAGVAEVAKTTLILVWIAACAKVANDYFNPKPPASRQDRSHKPRHQNG